MLEYDTPPAPSKSHKFFEPDLAYIETVSLTRKPCLAEVIKEKKKIEVPVGTAKN